MKKIISMTVAVILTLNLSAFATDNSAQWYAPEDVVLIVKVEGDPLLSLKNADKYVLQRREREIEKTQLQVMSSIEQKIPDAKQGYTYTNIFNGFSIETTSDKIDDIKALPGVVDVAISNKMTPCLPGAAEVTYSSPTYTADTIKPTGYTGEGQVIAVLDSEFYTSHEMFSTEPPNPRITLANINSYFTAETLSGINANLVYKSAKLPFVYDYGEKDYDTVSTLNLHGTHVAGIAAGNGGKFPDNTQFDGINPISSFSGAAPDAQLVLMKIADSSGSMYDATIIAALDDAAALNVDVINMSFGVPYYSAYNSMEYYKEIFNNINSIGATLCISAGNSGMGNTITKAPADMPDYSTGGTPMDYTNATAVANGTNLYIYTVYGKMTVGNNEIKYNTNKIPNNTFASEFAGKTIQYADCGLGTVSEFNDKNLTGKVALVKRGGQLFTDMSDRAAQKGAVALIIIDNNPSDSIEDVPSMGQKLSLPTALVTASGGDILKNSDTATISHQQNVYTESTNRGKIAQTSSYGVNESLELKPEITAPGQYIYSSYYGGAYARLTGTSMSSPYLAGTAAIVNEYLDKNGKADISGNTRANLIENMLMSTAVPITYLTEDGTRMYYSPRVQGAGMVNTAAAITTPAIIIGDNPKSKISLGEIENYTYTLNFTVKNMTDQQIVYDEISVIAMHDEPELIDGKYYTVLESNKMFENSPMKQAPVTVPANGEYTGSITVTLSQDEADNLMKIFTNGFFVDGFIRLGKSDKSIPDIGLPYTGFINDWNKAPVFEASLYDEESIFGNNGIYLVTKEKNTIKALGRDDNGDWDKNLIAISPNGDGNADSIGVNLTTLRSFKNFTMELQSNDNKSIYKRLKYSNMFPKMKPRTIFLQHQNIDLSTLPEGNYTFSIYGTFNNEGAIADKISIPVIIDKEYPEFMKVTLSDDGVYIKAKDNHELSYVGIKNNSTGAVTKASASNEDEIFIIIPDNSDIGNLSIVACDYAMNLTTVQLENASGNFYAEYIGYGSLNSVSELSVKIKNTTAVTQTGAAIAAFYDENDALIEVKREELNMKSNETSVISFVVPKLDASPPVAKLFLWDSLSNATPLDKAKKFTIQ